VRRDRSIFVRLFEARNSCVLSCSRGAHALVWNDPAMRIVHGTWTRFGTTNYLHDGYNVLEELDNSGNVLARYTRGKSLDEPLSELRSGITSYYEADGLVSTTSLSNGSGALANPYRAGGPHKSWVPHSIAFFAIEWGRHAAAAAFSPGFVGHRLDSHRKPSCAACPPSETVVTSPANTPLASDCPAAPHPRSPKQSTSASHPRTPQCC